MGERYLEDFVVGQTFGSGRARVTEEEIKAFAAEFDPQPFHLDQSAARESFFRGLAASGWHTAAITMRLLVESDLKPAGGVIGAGFDEFRWPRPVRPGDELHIECEVLEVRPSRSLPDSGFIKLRTTTLNQNDEPVQIQIGNLLVLRGNLGSPIRLLFCPGGFAQFEDTGRFHNPRRKAICGSAIRAPQRCPAPFSPLGLAVRRVCSGSKLPPSSRLHSKFECQLSYLRECRDSTR